PVCRYRPPCGIPAEEGSLQQGAGGSAPSSPIVARGYGGRKRKTGSGEMRGAGLRPATPPRQAGGLPHVLLVWPCPGVGLMRNFGPRTRYRDPRTDGMPGRSRTPLADFPARHIALLKPSALGDIVHSLPVLTALRRRYPSAAITWVV